MAENGADRRGAHCASSLLLACIEEVLPLVYPRDSDTQIFASINGGLVIREILANLGDAA